MSQVASTRTWPEAVRRAGAGERSEKFWRRQHAGHGSKRHIGSGAHGKGAGTGALTDLPKKIGDNMILSNRDKAQHSDVRGMDGKAVQTKLYQDLSANRVEDEENESRKR